LINETGRSHVHVQKGLRKYPYITTVGTPDALTLTRTYSAMKTPEHTEYETDDPEPTDEGHIRTDTPLISCFTQV